jgi:hypothetical protein
METRQDGQSFQVNVMMTTIGTSFETQVFPVLGGGSQPFAMGSAGSCAGGFSPTAVFAASAGKDRNNPLDVVATGCRQRRDPGIGWKFHVVHRDRYVFRAHSHRIVKFVLPISGGYNRSERRRELSVSDFRRWSGAGGRSGTLQFHDTCDGQFFFSWVG